MKCNHLLFLGRTTLLFIYKRSNRLGLILRDLCAKQEWGFKSCNKRSHLLFKKVVFRQVMKMNLSWLLSKEMIFIRLKWFISQVVILLINSCPLSKGSSIIFWFWDSKLSKWLAFKNGKNSRKLVIRRKKWTFWLKLFLQHANLSKICWSKKIRKYCARFCKFGVNTLKNSFLKS